MEKRTVRISVDDFPVSGDAQAVREFVVSEEGAFPAKFVLNQPNMLDGVAFLVCIEGTARVRINFRDYDVDANTVLTVLPNHVVEALAKSDDFRSVILFSSLDFVTDLPVHIHGVKQLGAAPRLTVSDEDKRILLDMHNLMVRLQSQVGYPLRGEVAKSMLYTLAVQLKAIYDRTPAVEREPASRRTELTEHFMRLLIDNYKSHRSPAFYADKLCVTPKYLSHVIRDVTGESLFSWINKLTVICIKNMLRTTSLSVAQISEELNFPNPSFFGRYFRQHTGMTPGQYRRSQ